MRLKIIVWLAYDVNGGGENTTQNLGSCQKVIPRRYIIIETANKIINTQGKSIMLDFLQIVVIYASKRWRQVGTPCIFHSR